MKTRRAFVRDSSKLLSGAAVASLLGGERVNGEEAKGTGLVTDPRYLDHLLAPRQGQPHPESPERLKKIAEIFAARGLDRQAKAIGPSAKPRPHIEAHHTEEHVASIRGIETSGAIAELAVAGALGAVDAVAGGEVRNAFCAIRPPGHHANNTGAEEGFCYYSNAAIAAKYAQRVHGFEKILIVDWDYHHGNGTQNAFYRDPTVLFYSSHDWQAYPGTGDPSLHGEGDGSGLNINVHLACGAKDKDMLVEWDRKLLPAASRFRPDFVIISAGFDSRKDDLLGCFDVTDDAFRRMTRTAMDVANDYCGGRLVSMLEGGYNIDGLARAAAAHMEMLLEG